MYFLLADVLASKKDRYTVRFSLTKEGFMNGKILKIKREFIRTSHKVSWIAKCATRNVHTKRKPQGINNPNYKARSYTTISNRLFILIPSDKNKMGKSLASRMMFLKGLISAAPVQRSSSSSPSSSSSSTMAAVQEKRLSLSSMSSLSCNSTSFDVNEPITSCNINENEERKTSSNINENNEKKEKMPAVIGEIIIPKRCFHSHPRIQISLQDSSNFRAIDEDEIDSTIIATCSLQPAFICSDDKLSFALPYSLPPANLLRSFFPTWYTLHIQVEDVDGNMACFDHQVTIAIDEEGYPLMERIHIPLINAQMFDTTGHVEKEYTDESVELMLVKPPSRRRSSKGRRPSTVTNRPARKSSKVEAE